MGRNKQIVAYLDTGPDRHGGVCVTFTCKLAERHTEVQHRVIERNRPPARRLDTV